jgi:hypothetical protein
MSRKANNSTARSRAPKRRSEPEASRPTVPGYHFSAKKKGLLPWKWAARRLEKSRQYWIATTRPDGAPHLMIIWGLWFQNSFWFNLTANPKCVVGTDDAAKAVILEGAVELIDPKGADYKTFAKAYEKKYKWDVREMAQPVYRFLPSAGFGLFEKKFEQTATRWTFR